MRIRGATVVLLALASVAPASAAAPATVTVTASTSAIAPGETVRVRVAVAAPGAQVRLVQSFGGPVDRVSFRGGAFDRRSGMLRLRGGRAAVVVAIRARRAGTLHYAV